MIFSKVYHAPDTIIISIFAVAPARYSVAIV